jgi:parallel beta-helix repeat protein
MRWFPWKMRSVVLGSHSPNRRRLLLRIERLEVRDLPSGATALLPLNPILVVHPGDVIQKVVNEASPGTTILIEPAVYRQTVTISTPNLALVGIIDSKGNRPVLESPSGADTGVTVVSASGGQLNGFRIANITVRDFRGSGLLLEGVSHFLIANVNARNNAEYGIFPVFSANGVITACSASGSNDTGIYVGQSNNISIQGNLAFDNVNGIEIENSSNVTASHNECRQNTVGILEDLLPGLTIEVSSNNRLVANFVHNNNRPNTAVAGDIASFEPSGIGILIVGGDSTVAKFNIVTGNGYAGIVLISGLELIALAGLPSSVYGTVDPNPENTLIAANVVLGNGQLFSYPMLPPGADLLWDGSGSNNHWVGNLFGTSDPPILP